MNLGKFISLCIFVKIDYNRYHFLFTKSIFLQDRSTTRLEYFFINFLVTLALIDHIFQSSNVIFINIYMFNSFLKRNLLFTKGTDYLKNLSTYMYISITLYIIRLKSIMHAKFIVFKLKQCQIFEYFFTKLASTSYCHVV